MYLRVPGYLSTSGCPGHKEISVSLYLPGFRAPTPACGPGRDNIPGPARKGCPMDSCSLGKAVFSLGEPGVVSIMYNASDQIGILKYNHITSVQCGIRLITPAVSCCCEASVWRSAARAYWQAATAFAVTTGQQNPTRSAHCLLPYELSCYTLIC